MTPEELRLRKEQALKHLEMALLEISLLCDEDKLYNSLIKSQQIFARQLEDILKNLRGLNMGR